MIQFLLLLTAFTAEPPKSDKNVIEAQNISTCVVETARFFVKENKGKASFTVDDIFNGCKAESNYPEAKKMNLVLSENMTRSAFEFHFKNDQGLAARLKTFYNEKHFLHKPTEGGICEDCKPKAAEPEADKYVDIAPFELHGLESMDQFSCKITEVGMMEDPAKEGACIKACPPNHVRIWRAQMDPSYEKLDFLRVSLALGHGSSTHIPVSKESECVDCDSKKYFSDPSYKYSTKNNACYDKDGCERGYKRYKELEGNSLTADGEFNYCGKVCEFGTKPIFKGDKVKTVSCDKNVNVCEFVNKVRTNAYNFRITLPSKIYAWVIVRTNKSSQHLIFSGWDYSATLLT